MSKEPDKRIRELEKLIQKKDREIAELNEIMKAYNRIEQMTNQELLDAEKKFRAQEQISTLSAKELALRDAALQHVLDVNKQMGSVREERTLLEIILESILDTLKAERGILFIVRDEFVIARIFKNITPDEIEKPYFQNCRSKITEARMKCESVYRLFQEFEDEEDTVNLSFVCLPLLYDKKLLGIIYLDILSDEKTFRIQDLDIAEIFTSQASIAMNNTQLYQKIRGQNLELLKLINLKDQLISEVSKKIKRPVIQIHGLVEKLLNDNPNRETPEDPSKMFQHLERIFNLTSNVQVTVSKVVQIQDLEKEVNDLFSDIVNFRELFNFILDYYKEEIARHNISVKMDLTDQFSSYHGNLTIMRTIFDELISNAIMYNRDNGSIAIKGYRRGDYLYIDIEDTGHGIKEEEQDKIFQQFYRTESSPEMNDKGAGLGLYLVKKFIKYYNGDIALKSEFGKGSRFRVSLLVN